MATLIYMFISAFMEYVSMWESNFIDISFHIKYLPHQIFCFKIRAFFNKQPTIPRNSPAVRVHFSTTNNQLCAEKVKFILDVHHFPPTSPTPPP